MIFQYYTLGTFVGSSNYAYSLSNVESFLNIIWYFINDHTF